jgi:hypothetical protein
MRLKTSFHRFFSTLHGFVILLFISVTLGATYATISLKQMNFEARGFVNLTMLDLLVDWDNRKFMTHTSHELQQKMTKEQLYNMRNVFRRLGRLLNYHGAYGGLYRSSTSIMHINPRYKVLASFKGGQFFAIITLIKQQGKWVIGRFEYKYTFIPNKQHTGSLKWA